MPDKPEPFFAGRVRMYAVNMDIVSTQTNAKVAEAEFDHSTREGRNQVRLFVHRHLCLGHSVVTIPL
jgi:hypothetical protein